MTVPIVRTERLLLCEWRDDDREPFARLNADLRVAELLGRGLTASDIEHRRK